MPCYARGPVYNIVLKDLYAPLLPRSMVSLSIHWTSPRVTRDILNLIAAKDSLLARLASLRRLWLCDSSKLALLWRHTASGTEERCNHFEENAKGCVPRRLRYLIAQESSRGVVRNY